MSETDNKQLSCYLYPNITGGTCHNISNVINIFTFSNSATMPCTSSRMFSSSDVFPTPKSRMLCRAKRLLSFQILPFAHRIPLPYQIGNQFISILVKTDIL